MKFNLPSSARLYRDDRKPQDEEMRKSPSMIDGYLLNAAKLFQPILTIWQRSGPVTVSDLSLHFRKKVQEILWEVFEWLALRADPQLACPPHLQELCHPKKPPTT
jgi:hypothetical protein